jgi:hypothetical protein
MARHPSGTVWLRTIRAVVELLLVLDVLWLAMPAFILLAVAEVVRRGVAMRAELDTVI